MDKLEKSIERIREDFDAKNEVRDLTLRRSRELIRCCANTSPGRWGPGTTWSGRMRNRFGR